MAATFNLLRGRDLIWSYVVNNYLLGEEPPPFDLLHWNSDTTNLPGGLAPRLSRDALQGEQAGREGRDQASRERRSTSMQVKTPTYVQAGREDHIAPPQSVWKIMDHFAGPKRFVLAGSGHIAGRGEPAGGAEISILGQRQAVRRRSMRSSTGATEHKGSWWPDWLEWLKKQDAETVKAEGARVPGKGKLKAIEDAPGSYVKAR